MIKYLVKFLYILPASNSQLIILILLFIGVSILETFGISLIGPFISLSGNPDFITDNHILNQIYQYFGFQDQRRFIALLGLFIITVFCIKSLISWYVQSYVFIFASKQKVKLTNRLMHAYLYASYTFHLNKSSASIIHNIIGETQRFNVIIHTFLISISNLIVILFLALLLGTTSSLALISLLLMGLPLIFLLNLFKQKVVRWGRMLSESNEEIIRSVNHGLGGIKETQVIGCEHYFEEQIDRQATIYADASGAFHSFKLCPRILIETLLVIFLVGFTSVFLLYSQQDIDRLTSVLSVFAIASIRLIPSITNLANGISKLQSSKFVLDKLYFDLQKLKSTKQESYQPKTIGSYQDKNTIVFRNQILLDKISYCYPNVNELALKDISLRLKKGESIALIGKSGAGKTTLVDVILGLLIPQQGNITVDGDSIYDNLRSWQNMVGYIPQSIFLIEDTIRKNIAFGVPEDLIDYQKLYQAIKAAQLQELVDELPNGIETFVGERGVRLSGGQRQRIGIARALYHEREILVLDEATAALDNETESLVTEAIKSLSGQKTIIIIAHRLTTVEHCDRIYLMEKGKIIKSGSYQEVVLANHSLS
ncbi:ABC transporter ATP-binding protein [Hyella patelloides LEGE 07179]|uniref:ABC transporter ATP-binding protein n=1 Tax=Hyella patelloides LEGE 07179 TaxID=945734 RepID=A0A563VMN7_9CYAN|nr:ABC transporter ATP-binding protein [Hyella patelloides]VEP12681.1 ABC transporter ATP-binding protein [Hyella patelloides LEGE 07179]